MQSDTNFNDTRQKQTGLETKREVGGEVGLPALTLERPSAELGNDYTPPIDLIPPPVCKQINLISVHSSLATISIRLCSGDTIETLISHLNLNQPDFYNTNNIKFIYSGRLLSKNDSLFDLITNLNLNIHCSKAISTPTHASQSSAESGVVASASTLAVASSVASSEESSTEVGSHTTVPITPIPSEDGGAVPVATSFSPTSFISSSFSLEPIAPCVVSINGVLYKLETGPAITIVNTPPIPQTVPVVPAVPNLQIRERYQVNIQLIWTILKMLAVGYFLSNGGSTLRMVSLGILGVVVVGLQWMGGLENGLNAAGEERDVVRPQPQEGPENVPDLVVPPQPRSLLGLLSTLIVCFFTSMVPARAPEMPEGIM